MSRCVDKRHHVRSRVLNDVHAKCLGSATCHTVYINSISGRAELGEGSTTRIEATVAPATLAVMPPLPA